MGPHRKIAVEFQAKVFNRSTVLLRSSAQPPQITRRTLRAEPHDEVILRSEHTGMAMLNRFEMELRVSRDS